MSHPREAPQGSLPVERLGLHLEPNQRRVLLRPFMPSLVVKPTSGPDNLQRLETLLDRLAALTDEESERELERLRHRFGVRHRTLEKLARQRWEDVLAPLQRQHRLRPEQQLLLGYYLTNEYALESAALFNPSLVPHPDQGGLEPGYLRVVLSLRATGEGHISSIEFRSGVLRPDGTLHLDRISPFVYQGQITRLEGDAEGSYLVSYEEDSQLSERVLFPVAARESNGLEDARFVRLEGVSVDPETYQQTAPGASWNKTQLPSPALPSFLQVLDGPFDDGSTQNPLYFTALARTPLDNGWRGAFLYESGDNVTFTPVDQVSSTA